MISKVGIGCGFLEAYNQTIKVAFEQSLVMQGSITGNEVHYVAALLVQYGPAFGVIAEVDPLAPNLLLPPDVYVFPEIVTELIKLSEQLYQQIMDNLTIGSLIEWLINRCVFEDILTIAYQDSASFLTKLKQFLDVIGPDPLMDEKLQLHMDHYCVDSDDEPPVHRFIDKVLFRDELQFSILQRLAAAGFVQLDLIDIPEHENLVIFDSAGAVVQTNNLTLMLYLNAPIQLSHIQLINAETAPIRYSYLHYMYCQLSAKKLADFVSLTPLHIFDVLAFLNTSHRAVFIDVMQRFESYYPERFARCKAWFAAVVLKIEAHCCYIFINATC
jgi:hypothetical protein